MKKEAFEPPDFFKKIFQKSLDNAPNEWYNNNQGRGNKKPFRKTENQKPKDTKGRSLC